MGVCHTEEKRTGALGFHGRCRLSHLHPGARTIPGAGHIGTYKTLPYFGSLQMSGTVSCYTAPGLSLWAKAEVKKTRFSLEGKSHGGSSQPSAPLWVL